MSDTTLIVIITQFILAIIAFLMNGLLIVLIILKSPQKLGTYKYIVISMSVFEVFYAGIDLLIKPEIRSKDDHWMSTTNARRSSILLNISYPLFLIWVCSFGVALACFGVHFVLRYLIVKGRTQWVTGSRNFCIWLSFPIMFGLLYAITVHICLHFDEKLDRAVREEIASAENIETSEITYFGFSFFKTVSSTAEVVADWTQITGLTILCGIITTSFVTMSYFGTNLYFSIRKLYNMKNNSEVSHALQTQLFYSLVIQTIIPVALIHFPCTLLFIAAFLGTGKEIYGMVLTVTILIFPAIDPLPSLIIIKPYRETIKSEQSTFPSEWTNSNSDFYTLRCKI
ncbi:hypothetical protein L3Y34_009378 [Caenorhabditis briggsae]|uniref:Seven TM Receptor n=1 Tax=Caenorhabditis briggsae TaxID=6238 RepID=A0AAE9A5M3_CAEBR|nr:hypothetical protein L3Y34_009378 [Caenorhabditis briggsae]